MKYLYFLVLLVGVIFISSCTVPSSNKIIFIPPPKLAGATVGEYYNYSFCQPISSISGATCGGLAGATSNPIGGKPAYTFSHQFNSGFIPTGMSIELNGLLRGTPTLPGNYTFGICVKDLNDEEVCKTVLLEVNPKSVEENVSPSITIDSAVVNVKETNNGGWCMATCTIDMSGTARGPVYTELRVCWALNGDASWCSISAKCTNWSTPGIYCARMSNEPGFTKWNIKDEWMYNCGEGRQIIAEIFVPKLPRKMSWNEYYAGEWETEEFNVTKTLICG